MRNTGGSISRAVWSVSLNPEVMCLMHNTVSWEFFCFTCISWIHDVGLLQHFVSMLRHITKTGKKGAGRTLWWWWRLHLLLWKMHDLLSAEQPLSNLWKLIQCWFFFCFFCVCVCRIKSCPVCLCSDASDSIKCFVISLDDELIVWIRSVRAETHLKEQGWESTAQSLILQTPWFNTNTRNFAALAVFLGLQAKSSS